jgi:hypothetical protein
MKRGHIPTTAAAALLAAAALGGASALAAAPPGTVPVLKFVEREQPNAGGFFDAPPAAAGEGDISPGDTFYGVSRLYSPKGRPIGRDQVMCAFVDRRGFAECGATVILARGSIHLRAGLRFTEGPGKFTVAVIGGTGAFEGVRGSSLITDRGNGRSDFTMRLIY